MRRVAVILMLVCLLPTSYADKQKRPQYRVEVNIVSIDLDVLDPEGQPVENLEQKDFLVKESGSRGAISRSLLINPNGRAAFIEAAENRVHCWTCTDDELSIIAVAAGLMILSASRFRSK
jgi:hypothetical protein